MLLAAGSNGVGAQNEPPPITYQAISPKLAGFLFAVIRHVPGENDNSVATMAPWTRRDLQLVVEELHRLARQAGSSSLVVAALHPYGVTSVESLNRLLKRAAMLNADVAVFHRTQTGYSLPPDDSRTPPFVSDDGHILAVTSGTFHWEAGRRLLDAVRPSPGNDADVRLWYQAGAAAMQSWSDLYELQPQLAQARLVFPRDAVFLLYDGTLHESYAQPAVQSVSLEQVQSLRSARAKPWFASAAEEWRNARALYEQALKIDPGLMEAHLRLAWVLAQQEEHQTALVHARQVLSGSAPVSPVARYFAWLLIGQEERMLNRRAEAETAYAEAVASFPEAQSPRLGLSQIARERGDRAQAVAEIAVLQTASKGPDPWWYYTRLHFPNTADLRSALAARLK